MLLAMDLHAFGIVILLIFIIGGMRGIFGTKPLQATKEIYDSPVTTATYTQELSIAVKEYNLSEKPIQTTVEYREESNSQKRKKKKRKVTKDREKSRAYPNEPIPPIAAMAALKIFESLDKISIRKPLPPISPKNVVAPTSTRL